MFLRIGAAVNRFVAATSGGQNTEDDGNQGEIFEGFHGI